MVGQIFHLLAHEYRVNPYNMITSRCYVYYMHICGMNVSDNYKKVKFQAETNMAAIGKDAPLSSG